MLGVIAGDIIGSVYEFVETKITDFPCSWPKASLQITPFLPWLWRMAC